MLLMYREMFTHKAISIVVGLTQYRALSADLVRV